MPWKRPVAYLSDGATCGLMRMLQWRLRHRVSPPERLAEYVSAHATLDPGQYFSEPADPPEIDLSQPGLRTWASPYLSEFPENNLVRMTWFPGPKGPEAPTVLFLHALMSASSRGYFQWAGKFNEAGWNACFIEMPYHYGKKPQGFLNGELAISSDLVATAESLRQGVAEVRQVLRLLRRNGCRQFGLWATSYGGWIGGLTAALEADWKFLLFITPIVDVDHAIWESAAAAEIRRQLQSAGVTRTMTEPMMRLTSPKHYSLRADDAVVLVGGGLYDRIVDPLHLRDLPRSWPGAETYFMPQGHFGYSLMSEGWRRVRGLLQS